MENQQPLSPSQESSDAGQHEPAEALTALGELYADVAANLERFVAAMQEVAAALAAMGPKNNAPNPHGHPKPIERPFVLQGGRNRQNYYQR